MSYIAFVANVNRNDGKLKANVNRFSNDNVWNADNRNRVVVPKLFIFQLFLRKRLVFVFGSSLADLFSKRRADGRLLPVVLIFVSIYPLS